MATVNPDGKFFSMGNNTLKVPMALFAKNRLRLVDALKGAPSLPKSSIVLLQGGITQ